MKCGRLSRCFAQRVNFTSLACRHFSQACWEVCSSLQAKRRHPGRLVRGLECRLFATHRHGPRLCTPQNLQHDMLILLLSLLNCFVYCSGKADVLTYSAPQSPWVTAAPQILAQALMRCPMPSCCIRKDATCAPTAGPCRHRVCFWASKGLPYHDFGACVCTIMALWSRGCSTCTYVAYPCVYLKPCTRGI